ncbi:MAG: acyl carrier protein [Bdellovibrionales bacterium]|nr:acyl carrier protein [Bdellovibrionales bacterium]
MEKISEILREIRPDLDFSNGRAIFADDGLDSLDLIRFVSELETTFAIAIDGRDILPENFKDIISVETLVKKMKARAQ